MKGDAGDEFCPAASAARPCIALGRTRPPSLLAGISKVGTRLSEVPRNFNPFDNPPFLVHDFARLLRAMHETSKPAQSCELVEEFDRVLARWAGEDWIFWYTYAPYPFRQPLGDEIPPFVVAPLSRHCRSGKGRCWCAEGDVEFSLRFWGFQHDEFLTSGPTSWPRNDDDSDAATTAKDKELVRAMGWSVRYDIQ